MRLKKQLELIDPRVWRDKNIKFETKLIYKILCAEQSQRCEFTSISIGRVQKKLSITNVGFKKNLKIWGRGCMLKDIYAVLQAIKSM